MYQETCICSPASERWEREIWSVLCWWPGLPITLSLGAAGPATCFLFLQEQPSPQLFSTKQHPGLFMRNVRQILGWTEKASICCGTINAPLSPSGPSGAWGAICLHILLKQSNWSCQMLPGENPWENGCSAEWESVQQAGTEGVKQNRRKARGTKCKSWFKQFFWEAGDFNSFWKHLEQQSALQFISRYELN